ncbi:MAG TPA: biopolymer transporter ExbD [Steroidobacteraceae bacterium]|nr:biopolymer transporter ExbD [Steroidobacteraceae bacterium]
MKRGSLLARRQQRNHARYRGRGINIVPMLDVMVILTFFLIFTAVFSKTSVLEVNLPVPGKQAAATPPRFELELILRSTGIEVAERRTGVLTTIPAVATGQDVARLTDYLAVLKQRVPDVTNATLLVADDVDYDTIVQVMDATRVRQVVDGARVVREPLFPQVALGDAPT